MSEKRISNHCFYAMATCFAVISFFDVMLVMNNVALRKKNVAQYNKDSEKLEYYRHVVNLRDYTIRAYKALATAKTESNKKEIAFKTLRIKQLIEANELMDNSKELWSNWPEMKKAKNALMEKQSDEQNVLIEKWEKIDADRG